VAAVPPVTWVLEAVYRMFLLLRRAWRPAAGRWPAALTADLRSDQAGEAGAVQIYRGVLAIARDPALRAFAAHHLATEQRHLAIVLSHLPVGSRSRLLPAWRAAGWLTGALPALFGPGAVYATIVAVETFVDRHYAAQTGRIDRLISAAPDPAQATALRALRADLESCRQEELGHRDEAARAGPATGSLLRLWTGLVARGSAGAVVLARRF
jgi:demethoxyubiquinone hydroxylase (CLK1/Coq7/Cat5 family)